MCIRLRLPTLQGILSLHGILPVGARSARIAALTGIGRRHLRGPHAAFAGRSPLNG